MRFFITGATGYLGSALVRIVLGHKHEVHGLVRTAERARKLEALGGRPVIGAMEQPATYEEAASDCDVLVHLALGSGPDADRVAIEALLQAAYVSARPRTVIYTSGVWALREGGSESDENTPTGAAEVSAWRVANEYVALNGQTNMISTAVIRPGMVYGGSEGFISAFFAEAAETGEVSYVGDGMNRWSLVNRDDTARLYRIVGEKRARGIFHGVENAPIRLGELARICSEVAGTGATRSIPLDDARSVMGPLANALAGDRPASARRSSELGWSPEWEFRDDVTKVYEEWKESS